VAAAGGTGTVNVTTAGGCAWTATSNANWLTVTSGASGTGNGTVGFTAQANTGPARSGTLTIAGQTFTVNQANGCTYTLTPTNQNFAAGGGTGTVAVTGLASCAWTAISNAAWLTVTSGSSGSGNGTVGFSVALNLGAARTAQLTIGDKTFTVNQAAASTTLANVSAASYLAGDLAVESIVSAFGASLSTASASATNVPLPTTLAGTVVRIKDSANIERLAPLFFVSSAQINYQVPADSAPGTALITIISSSGTVTVGNLTIARVAPALFTANANGRDVPAGLAVRVRNGVQTTEAIATLNTTTNRFVATPIDVGPATDTVVIVLYGTGFRFRNGLDQVSVRFTNPDTTNQPVNAEVQFAGPAPGFAGLDQLNFVLPRALAGRGLQDVLLTVEGKTANLVKLNIK
jgi:uncharacterized protein (TIGR03437 family)